MASPWDTELRAAAPALTVRPHQRWWVLDHLRRRGVDPVPYEAAAHRAAGGRLRLYITFVEKLMDADPAPALPQYDEWCRTADCTQTVLSAINRKRDSLLSDLHTMRFRCDEVPEASQSSRQCPDCKSTDLMAYGRQTRSADEGQTIFYVCLQCRKDFK